MIKKMTPQEIIKIVASVVGVIIALYAFVYVPSQELAIAKQSIERIEAATHNSCVLLAEQTTQEAIANPPAGVEEEPTQEQINEFLNVQYARCAASEGFNPEELAEQFLAPALEQTAQIQG